MKKSRKTKKYSKPQVSTSGVCEAFGEGGVIFADIRAEFPEISECGGAGRINEFYSSMLARLYSYAKEELRALGESEFAALGSGVARFRFRRYSLVHTYRVTWSDERHISILRTLRLARGSRVLSERAFGEVFDTARGRFVPPESFVTRSAIRRAFSVEPRIRADLEHKANFYTDGKRLVFLFGDEGAEVRHAELAR